MGTEYEKKYRATPEQLSAIVQGLSEKLRTVRMHTRYYDTPSGALSARHYTLRCRQENDMQLCTVKAPLSEFARGEWEVKCADVYQALPELCRQGAPAELEALAREGLVCICQARFVRKAALVKTPECSVEIACDEGILIGAGKELSFSEVEVELKEGPYRAADRFAQVFATLYGLTPERRSKFARALELYRGEK